jgi:hypothetical protein
LPSPQTLLSAAVPPQVRFEVSTAVESSSATVAATFPCRAGFSDQMSATVPATCGEAIDVPLNAAYEFVGTLLRTLTPGAAMFGFSPPPKADAPRLEKLAIALLMSKAPAL